MNYSKKKYLTEQTSDNTINRIKKYIEYWNQLSDEDKKNIGEDPNGVGYDFFSKTEELLTNLSSSKEPYSDDSKKTISDFKNTISQYPKIYDTTYKSKFDKIFPEVASVPNAEETPSAEGTKTSLIDRDKKRAEESDDSGLDGSGQNLSTEKPETKQPSEKYATGYTGVSIIDFLDQSGKKSDFASRAELAKKMGIPEYKGSASQNLLMLNALRSGQKEIAVKPAEFSKAAPPPQIKFGGSNQTAYIDMGGGRYAPASEDQLGDPNVQLYVKNPKKGQGEYLKPNYVKVRREGGELRRQSQFGGALGSLSNFLGDVGNTLAGKNREDNESSYNDDSTENNIRPTEDRPPARRQSKDGGRLYQRNPEGVESFFK